jgi:type II secretory pathway component GspD/PulD (secretin)
MGTFTARSKLPSFAHLIRCAIFLALAATRVAAAQEMTLEIIQLQHRGVDDILPIIEPLVAPGGTVTGTGNQLIVKTTAANLAEIKQVLVSIDRALKQLRVTVTQDVAAHSEIQEDALSGRVRSGDFAARVPDHGLHDGASVGYKGENGAVRYRALSTRSSRDQQNSHFVTTVEGRPAFIYTGRDVPYPSYSGYYGPRGGGYHEGIEFQPVRSGIYVTPRLQGDRVTIEVAPQLENVNPSFGGSIDTRGTATTVSGRLGEWIPVGGVNQADSRNGSANLARTRRYGRDVYDVWVKVDLIP